MPRRRRSSTDEIPVHFRFRPPRPAAFVDLRGEMTHFHHLSPMRQSAPDLFEAVVRLGPGAYSYKLFGGGDDWWLDPQNPRTRSRDGARNSVVVVGGTEEPILHAPARPFVFVEDDGRLCLRAALRRGASDGLAVRWDEGDGPRETPLAIVADEDEHLLCEVRLPASARAIDYVFVLADGRLVGRAGGVAQSLHVARADVEPSAPSWWREAVVYTVLVDRFRRGETGARGAPPASDLCRWGGDLEGVTAALPYLADLGVTVLHLSPIALAPSSHRYDAIDPRVVDPALGGEAALVRLLQAAHDRGLRVLLDVAVTHVERDFFAFRDVIERGPRSPYFGWFFVHHHPFGEGPDQGYEHYQKGQWREPLLRTDEPEVAAYLAGTFARWAELGADGFRVDAAADVPLATLRTIADAARAAREDVALFGEVVPHNIHRFSADALDAATDFALEEALYDWLWRKQAGASRTALVAARRRFDRGGPAWSALAFTATHDQHRFRSLTKDPRPARLAHLFVLLGAPVPMLLYGDEVGLCADGASRAQPTQVPISPASAAPAGWNTGSLEFEGVWPDRAPMPWPAPGEEVAPAWDRETLDLVRAALRLRRDSAAIARGDDTFFAIAPDGAPHVDAVLVMRRSAGDEIVDVILNGSDDDHTVPLAEGAPSGGRVLLALGAASFDAAAGLVRLGPYAALVLLRTPPDESARAWQEIAGHTRALSGLAFRDGSPHSAPLPASLYLTVTERCNLQCAHCITFAPEKTAEGRARTAAPWLLEALREPFSAASYFAFVHGGESLVAPVFWDVLRAIGAARASRPGRHDIHLLSNGMLLDEARVRRLIDGGLTSLSVSLDGATEITNDTLRKGGRLPVILGHLRRAAQIRRETGADLRIGVSTVVTAGNVGELAALGRIVLDLGLDWIKVEEIFPCTPVARHQMIFAREPRVEEAMSELRRALARSEIVIVDHRDPPGGCACDAARHPLLAEFRRADDFANRTSFHPCRMEWEQACIDPDGTVHPVDYGRPPIGNLLRTSLLEMWNGPEMTALRTAALRRTPRDQRRACPFMT